MLSRINVLLQNSCIIWKKKYLLLFTYYIILLMIYKIVYFKYWHSYLFHLQFLFFKFYIVKLYFYFLLY